MITAAKRQFIRDLFGDLIRTSVTTKGGTYTLKGNDIVLAVDDYSYNACGVEDFLAMFDAAIPDPPPSTAGKPVSIYQAFANADADGQRGWTRIFDGWRTEGRIS